MNQPTHLRLVRLLINNIQLSPQDQRFQPVVRQYIKDIKKSQIIQTQNAKPYIMPKTYNFYFTIFLTLIMVLLNSQNLFKQSTLINHQISQYQMPNQVQRHIEWVFQHTINKYKVVYLSKIIDCQSYIPFSNSQTFCSQKSIDLKINFYYFIGYKPNLETLEYDNQNNSLKGQWGPLQILQTIVNHTVQQQQVGLFSSWSLIEFQQKLNKKINYLKPKAQKNITQHIENLSKNPNSIQTIQKKIKNSLIQVLNKEKQNKVHFSTRLMDFINQKFNNVLSLFSFKAKIQTKNAFNQDLSHQEENIEQEMIHQIIIDESELSQIQNIQINQGNNKQQNNQNDNKKKSSNHKQIGYVDPQKAKRDFKQLSKKVK